MKRIVLVATLAGLVVAFVPGFSWAAITIGGFALIFGLISAYKNDDFLLGLMSIATAVILLPAAFIGPFIIGSYNAGVESDASAFDNTIEETSPEITSVVVITVTSDVARESRVQLRGVPGLAEQPTGAFTHQFETETGGKNPPKEIFVGIMNSNNLAPGSGGISNSSCSITVNGAIVAEDIANERYANSECSTML